MFALVFAWVAAGSPAAQKSVPNCNVDTAQMLKLSPYDFDQTKRGWRALAEQGCDREAADLIAAYRQAHFAIVNPSALQMSYWHEGQERAFQGRNDLAVTLLLASVQPPKSDVPEALFISLAWTDYALATVAFLNGDKHSLERARGRLAAVPEPASYSAFYQTVPANLKAALKWPPNLNVVDGLIACFGRPYAKAYSCKVARRPRR